MEDVKDSFDLDRCRIFIADIQKEIESLKAFYDSGVICYISESICGAGTCEEILKIYKLKREEYNV